MLERWSIVMALSTTGNPRELKRIYGEAVISRVEILQPDSPGLTQLGGGSAAPVLL